MTSKFVRGFAVAAVTAALAFSGAGLASAAPEPAHDRFPCAATGPCDYWRSADGLTFCSEGSCANYDRTGHFLCYTGEAAFGGNWLCDSVMMPIARLLPPEVPLAQIWGTR